MVDGNLPGLHQVYPEVWMLFDIGAYHKKRGFHVSFCKFIQYEIRNPRHRTIIKGQVNRLFIPVFVPDKFIENFRDQGGHVMHPYHAIAILS